MTSHRRLLAALTLLISALVVDGCGSGGGGGANSQIAVCDLNAFTPNYAARADHLLNWPSFPVNVYFVRDANYTADRQTVAQAGFDQWVTATGGILNYRVTTSPSSADITVSFDPTTANGVTQVTFAGLTLDGADMHIGIKDQAASDMQCVAAHEFGHALGIDGHSDDPNDLMYPIHYQGTTCPVTQRDLNTMKTAYCSLFGRAYSSHGPLPTGKPQTKTIPQNGHGTR